jgi:hypothetical protein
MSSKYFLIVFSCLLLAGCDLSGPQEAIDDFELIIGLEPINTVVSGQIMDAATGELVEDEVVLQFTGEDSDAIIDVYSDPLSKQTVNGGLISFGIDNSVVPSDDNPVRFTVVAEADGYLEASEAIVLRSTEDEQFTLHIVDEDNPPEGSSSTQDTGGKSDSQGTITSGFDVETPEEQQSKGSASITVDDGTVASDASGNPLTGQLTTRLTYFNNSSERSLRSLPGGVDSGPNGNPLVTAGFASINISDQNGRSARTFNKPIDIGLRVPADMTNPATGQPVQPGETIDVYSYESEDGEWVAEGEVTLGEEQSDGTFRVSHAADHLSYYSLGFAGINSCQTGATINVNRNGNTGPLDVNVSAQGVSRQYRVRTGESSVTLRDAPDMSVQVSISVPGGTSMQTVDLCSGSYTFELPEPPNQLLDVTFELVPVCSNSNEGVRVESIPSFVVYYRKSDAQGASWNRGGKVEWTFNEEAKSLERGTLSIDGLEEGQTYIFKTTYEGETKTRQETVTGETIRIEENADDYCQ